MNEEVHGRCGTCCLGLPGLDRRKTIASASMPSRSEVIGYSSLSMSLSAMHTIFALYVTRFFLEVYLMEAKYFVACQLVFSIWNALNDPLVGWLMENQHWKLSSFFSLNLFNSPPAHLKRRGRLDYVRYGGFLLSMALLLPFFTWPQDIFSLVLSPFGNRQDLHSESSGAVELESDWIYQWALSGHYLMTVIIYDGLFTCISLAQGGLLAELAINEEGRAGLVGCGSVFYGIGALTALIGEYLFQLGQRKGDHGIHLHRQQQPQQQHNHAHSAHHQPDKALAPFRLFVVVLSLVAIVGYWYTANWLAGESSSEAEGERKREESESESEREDGKEKDDCKCNTEETIEMMKTEEKAEFRKEAAIVPLDIRTFLTQVVRQKNLWYFAGMKFAQEMNCLFFATFVGSFATHLLGDSTSAFMLSCIVAGSAVAPRILTVSLTTSLLQQGRCESYSVARWLFYCRAIAAVAMGGIVVIYFQYGSLESVLLICTAIYLICGRAMTETSCEIVTNMSLSDVIDEDMVANQRKNRVSSAIIGCCQLLSRPAQSISPILVVWLLEPYNFTSSTDGASDGSSCTPELKRAIYAVLVLLPATCALVQLFFWRMFTLHDAHLQQIKAKLKGQ